MPIDSDVCSTLLTDLPSQECPSLRYDFTSISLVKGIFTPKLSNILGTQTGSPKAGVLGASLSGAGNETGGLPPGCK
jgi:hypothetical protein